MSRARPSLPTERVLLVALGLLVAAFAPAAALAADPVGVSGTVTDAGGAPVAGVEVTVMVAGSDIVQAATTDEAGAFAFAVDAAVGDRLDIRARAPTVTSGPDEQGCTTTTTATGSASVPIDALPLGAVTVVLDRVIEGRVCAATATPEPPTKRPHARPTPPATDGPALAPAGGSGWLAIVAGLACLSAAGLVVAGRRRG